MVRFGLLAVGVAASFAVGVYSRPREASAAPAACPKFECKTYHAYWPGNNSPRVWAYFTAVAAPGVGAAAISAPVTPLFTPVSFEKLPAPPVPNVLIDALSFNACAPMCGLDPGNGKWQAPQEVTEMGANNPNFETRGIPRFQCTPTVGGAVGPKATDESNQENPGDVPPGLVDAGGDPAPPIGGN